MKIPRFWALGEAKATSKDDDEIRIEAHGWSDVSVEDARRAGVERAQRSLIRILTKQEPFTREAEQKEYRYADVPPREEVVERIEEGGREVAVLTRNGYGSVILNTDCVMFVDIDAPKTRGGGRGAGSGKGLGGWLKSLFAPEGEQKSAAASSGNGIEARVREWHGRNAGASLRLYRTRAGYRVLFTDALREPQEPRVSQIFSELGADELYVKLTEKQKSFRARLTPKPWRIDVGAPPVRFPWKSDAAEARFREWEKGYRAAAVPFSTCQLVCELGAMSPAPVIRRIVDLHDGWSVGRGELA